MLVQNQNPELIVHKAQDTCQNLIVQNQHKQGELMGHLSRINKQRELLVNKA